MGVKLNQLTIQKYIKSTIAANIWDVLHDYVTNGLVL